MVQFRPNMKPRRANSAADDLEISEDLDFQRRSWCWERIGQWMVAGLVVAALAGLFGGGPLSVAREEGEAGVLRVEYPRFARNQSSFELHVEVARAAVKEGRVQLWIDADVAGALTFDAISPEPERVELGRQRLLYQFSVGEEGELAPIIFYATTRAIGLEGGEVGLFGGGGVPLRWFVYP